MAKRRSNVPDDPLERRRRSKQRARRNTLRRLAVFAVVVILALVLWQNWDTLAPDKLISRLQDSMNDSGDGWPVDVSGSGATRLVRTQSYTAVLSDSYLTYYNSRGGEVTRYGCSYSAPLLRQAGKYVLLAEQEGRRLLLTTRSALLQELTMEEKILSVAINEKGRFAVLTQGPGGYAVKVTVYDRKGEQIYARSRMSMATEVAISPDGERVALLSVQAQNGSLSSAVEVFDLESDAQDALFTYTAKDTMLYRLTYVRQELVAVGEERAVALNDQGQAAVFTTGASRILGYCVGERYVALALRDYGETAGGQVAILDGNGVEHARVDFAGDFRHLSAEGDRFLLLTDSAVQTVTEAGAGKQAAVAADGRRAVQLDGKAIVLGLNTLQAYSLS